MLRFFPLFALILFSAFSLCAQEPVKENQVPPEILEDFGRRFYEPEKVQWFHQKGQYFGARFEKGGEAAEAVYTEDGNWLQSEEGIAYKEMPDPARQYCRDNYPEYRADKVKKVRTRKYGILYEIKILSEVKQVGMTFDMHGKLLEENENDLEPEGEKKGGLKGKLGKLLKRKSE